MVTKRLKLSLGDILLVPLTGGGYACGVVARKATSGVVFGYFFGPKLDHPDDYSGIDLRPEKAVLVCRFGDHGLFTGKWKVIGHVDNWSESEWPLPVFVGYTNGEPFAYLRVYDDSLSFLRETKVLVDEIDLSAVVKDAMWGSGVVEVRLSELLS